MDTTIKEKNGVLVVECPDIEEFELISLLSTGVNIVIIPFDHQLNPKQT